MKMKIIAGVFLLSLTLIMVASCEKKGNETNISFHGGTESHNMGQNCMNCHKSGGPGEGWFNVAGTVYDSLQTSTYPNPTLRLYTGPNGTGTLKYTIDGDAFGNFFTTATVDFAGGLYPAVTGNTGTQFMSSAITVGTCNNCHGVSTEKIWTN